MKKLKEERPVSPPPVSALIQITQRQRQLEPEKVLSLFMRGVLCGCWKKGCGGGGGEGELVESWRRREDRSQESEQVFEMKYEEK